MSTSRSTASHATRKTSKPAKSKARGGKAQKIAKELESKRAVMASSNAPPSTPASDIPSMHLKVQSLALVDDEGRVRALLGTDSDQRSQILRRKRLFLDLWH